MNQEHKLLRLKVCYIAMWIFISCNCFTSRSEKKKETVQMLIDLIRDVKRILAENNDEKNTAITK